MTGRWLSRDPLAENGGVNLYAFCNNDPVNGVDRLGLEMFKTERCGFFPYGYVPYYDSDATLLSWNVWEHLLTGALNVVVLADNLFYGCLDVVGCIGAEVDNACVYFTGQDSAELYMNAAQAGPIVAGYGAIPYAVYRAGTGIRTGIAWITRDRASSLLSAKAAQGWTRIRQLTPARSKIWTRCCRRTNKSGIPTKFLKELDGVGSWLMTKEQYDKFAKNNDLIGRFDGQHMTSARQMNKLIYEEHGDTALLSKKLGTKWSPEEKLIRVDVYDPLSFSPRLPDSSMSGANSQFVYGGETIGGVPEIATDRLPWHQVWFTPVRKE